MVCTVTFLYNKFCAVKSPLRPNFSKNLINFATFRNFRSDNPNYLTRKFSGFNSSNIPAALTHITEYKHLWYTIVHNKTLLVKMHRTPLLPTPIYPDTMPPPLMPHYPPTHGYPPPPPRPHQMRTQPNSNESQRTVVSQLAQINPIATNPKPKHLDSLKIAVKQIE